MVQGLGHIHSDLFNIKDILDVCLFYLDAIYSSQMCYYVLFTSQEQKTSLVNNEYQPFGKCNITSQEKGTHMIYYLSFFK